MTSLSVSEGVACMNQCLLFCCSAVHSPYSLSLKVQCSFPDVVSGGLELLQPSAAEFSS